MFKLINQGKPVIHRYTKDSQYWGHAMQGFNCKENDVHFQGLITYSVSGSCFSEIPLRAGDFITRNMQSGKIGLYEIQSAIHPSGWAHDFYNFTAYFCGYLEDGAPKIYAGYGIKEPVLSVFQKFTNILKKNK